MIRDIKRRGNRIGNKTARRYILGGGLVLAISFIIFVGFILSWQMSLLGSYIAIGILLAILINESYLGDDKGTKEFVSGNSYKKFLIVFFVSTSLLLLVESRLLPLLVGTPLFYYYILQQINYDFSEFRLVFCVSCVFLFIGFSQIIATGFYYGGSDTFLYVYEIEQLIAHGNISILDRKEQFPLYYVLFAISSNITRLPVYESLVYIGSFLFLMVKISIYLLSRTFIPNKKIASAVIIGCSLLPVVYHFSIYLIPFSLGMVFLSYLFFLYTKFNNSSRLNIRRIPILGVILIVGVLFTHHQSIFLFLCLMVILFGVGKIHPITAFSHHQSKLFVILSLTVTSYWALIEEQFIIGSVTLGTYRVSNLAQNLVTDTDSTTEPYTLGEIAFKEGFSTQILWLITPDGLFQICLASLISLSIISFYKDYSLLKPLSHIYVVGFLSSMIFLQTILSIPGLSRFQLVTVPFFVFVIGISIFGFFVRNQSKKSKMGFLILVLILSICNPLSTAGDIGGLNPHITDPPKNDLDTNDYSSIELVSEITSSDQAVSSFHVEQRALSRFGVPEGSSEINKSEVHIDEGLFLYRSEWTDHRAVYRNTDHVSNSFVFISDRWLQNSVASENKVFTTGSVGLVWKQNSYSITGSLDKSTKNQTI